MKLSFGCNRALPEGVRMAWGARLIAPNDLVHDRQGAYGEQGESADELLAWLNGGVMREVLQRLAMIPLAGSSDEVVTLYEDDRGVVKGSAQASFGYVYVSAWLHKDVPA